MKSIVLQPNDTVALIAPAGFIPDESPLLAAEKWLTDLGLKSVRGQYVLGKKGAFSGTDKERIFDVQQAINNPEVKAIWTVRGGYGVTRIIDKINYQPLLKNPKLLIGFSDVTALHLQWYKLGLTSIHGIMPIQMAKFPEDTQEGLQSLQKALLGESLTYQIPFTKHNRLGNAEGALIGGNLTLIESLLGTPYQPNFSGKILFLEDVSEYAYRVDRMLQCLRLAGVFEQINGLIVGGFTDIKDEKGFGYKIHQIIKNVMKNKKYPVFFHFPAGHFPHNLALILGREVRVNVTETESELTFL